MNDFLSRAVPYLKATDASSAGATIALDDRNSPVLRTLVDNIAITYVVDEPTGLVFVQRRHLQDAGVTIEQLHTRAMANLSQLCATKVRVEKHGPIYGVFLDGNFEASLFILESLWQRDLAHLVNKGFVVGMPARDILAFCDMDSPEGLETLRQMGARVKQSGDHLLTLRLFRLHKKSA